MPTTHGVNLFLSGLALVMTAIACRSVDDASGPAAAGRPGLTAATCDNAGRRLRENRDGGLLGVSDRRL
jgi:hypothetical protein